MKSEVYSWRVSAHRKAELESEARREGTSLAALLDRITADWLTARRNRRGDDEAGQVAIRRRVMATVGTLRPTRSARTSELVREVIRRKREREFNPSRRTD